MRFFGTRVVAATATLLALLGLTVGTASADRWVQTVYGEPTTYYVPSSYVSTSYVPTTYVPTSRYVSTGASYYVPTSYSYVLPASYATTAYTTMPTSTSYAAPGYVETSYYRRPGLLRRLANRPVIETSRVYRYETFPTSAYLPTTISYEAPMTMATSYGSPCGETNVPFDPPQAANAATTSKAITSTPANGGEPTYVEKAATKANPVKPADPRDVPKDADDAPGGAGDLTVPPNVPAKDTPKSPTDTRTSFRPQYKEVQPRTGAASMPMLRGEVVSGTSGVPKPNMEVVFTDLKGTYPDKTRKTDAKGAFEVYLPNGGWAVSVVDPVAGGKPKEYLRITSTNGRYLDEDDSPLAGVRINN